MNLHHLELTPETYKYKKRILEKNEGILEKKKIVKNKMIFEGMSVKKIETKYKFYS